MVMERQTKERWGISLVFPQNPMEFLLSWYGACGNSTQDLMWLLIPFATIWLTWPFRNDVVLKVLFQTRLNFYLSLNLASNGDSKRSFQFLIALWIISLLILLSWVCLW